MATFPQGPWVSRILAALVLTLSVGLGAYATLAPPQAGKWPTFRATSAGYANSYGSTTIPAVLDLRAWLGKRDPAP